MIDKEGCKKTIVETAPQLANEDRNKLDWVNVDLGRISLVRLESVPHSKIYYELNHVGLLDEDDTFPAARYIFLQSGELIGVIRSKFNENNIENVEDAMRFQIENELCAPGEDDYLELSILLNSGLLDAPIIEDFYE